MTCTLAENWKFYSVAVAVEGQGHSGEWEPRDTQESKREMGMETRGQGLLSPTIHP